MRARIASLSFFLASAAVAGTWLTLLPVLMRVLDALHRSSPPGSAEAELLDRVRDVLPFYLGADLILIALVCFAILHFALGRPLRRTEEAIDQLGSHHWDLPVASGGGPLLSRIQTSLRRMASALADERALTEKQLGELRAANERIGHAQAELVASERLATVGRLAAGVAHEVGNPLSGILGYLSLLRSRAQDTQLRAFIDQIEAEVQRIDRIVRGLLDLGRPAQGAPQPVTLSALVGTCVQLVAASPELNQVKVNVAIPHGMVARADPGPLSQVVLNLLLNAAQAMGGQGSVCVSAVRNGGTVSLEVEDDGPGLTPEVAARMFEPFFTTRAAGKGTGLGLAVSLHLARSMGGQLRGENRAEGGARFTLELPAA
jgi:two-component system, NtrC family, sensor kinase